MFEFCHEHLKGIAFTYIKDEEIIQHHNNQFLDQFENSVAITGIRSFHCFVPVSESNLKCFITSQAMEYEIHSTTYRDTTHKKAEITCELKKSENEEIVREFKKVKVWESHTQVKEFVK
ncbi:hypothetical protein AVEN_73461-1 [Araneus ventricosus]|uniref:Uncharacterized protein n=1 Tax=Araneus ventricosus TaxID=182803 RepID=A0A4Y2LVH7_ARAVE|nr:hypothetical protein AVEN_73461-1 [Araneus ventricosus]